MKYLLDTDTLSFIARGEHPALTARLMSCVRDDLAISAVTRGEAEYGLRGGVLRRDTQRRMQGLLLEVQCLAVSEEVAIEYGHIRSALRSAGTPIGPNDMWIAAHARCLGLTVVTHNTREFARVARLKVEDWLR